ncbi:SDR family oxidoreductase [Jiella sp. MQZ9-1]|uniref:SDR family oxidoreductase n=1 Tax=Jiella flava TaxID=2816857 RepID=A0A939FZ93_9HYPH|nr:SDR family oxidoreductase [Jiella flava]MBO0662252.1 SDR family oxidoreductase [Jiella flava]MCD2470917.1 SDR family oxidoreductase [Jiella flava]
MPSTDPSRLDGQVALVTGASSGIGRACATMLAAAGAHVVVNYVGSAEAADAVVRDIETGGSRAIAVQADVSKEDEVVAMFDTAERELGPLDIVMSNAGIQKDAKIGDMTLDDWNAVIDINLTGGFLVGREAIRRFRAKGRRPDVSRALGKLVFDASVHQVIPWAFHVNYAASKGGIHMLMQSLAQEVAREGIRVNSVAPGAIATSINAKERESHSDDMLKLIPYGRIGEPEDIGRVVAWLVSDAADYIVGQTLFTDGGMTLFPGFRGNG